LRFNEAEAALKAIGIEIKTVPGEYIVFKRGSSLESFRTDDLAAAVEHGKALATLAPSLRELPPIGPMGRKSRRGEMYRHNRKIAAKRAKAARDG
jgi:hypothetical protein